MASWLSSIIHPTSSLGAVGLVFWSHISIPNDSGGPGGDQLWLFRVRENLEVPYFKPFLRHLSVPSLLRPVCFPAAAYPVGIGSAAIRHTMLPNNRRVRWLSARSSQ